MAEYQFKGDVVEGEAGEEFIIEYLTTNWKGTLLEQKRDYTWDFKIDFTNAGILTFELKTDVYCIPDRELNGKKIKGKDTGNIFIEFSCRGKDSGIKVTEDNAADQMVSFLAEKKLI
jgi:hypothetical protein